MNICAVVGGFRLLGPALLCAAASMPPAQAQDATSLRARHAELSQQLASNPYQRPIHIESRSDSGGLRGDVYARIDQPFAVVGAGLRDVDQWCDILILHQNVKGCRTATPKAGDVIGLYVGRKVDQPLADAYRFEFAYQVVAAGPEYLQLVLKASDGPLGTRDYDIRMEVVELDDGQSFLHFSYAYAQGAAARLAARFYLATIGRSKVGFSVVGSRADGSPLHIGGTRGVVERNAMRFYLAIESYIGALAVPVPERVEKRLRDWHAGVERYPVQLHELERDPYLAMKRKEIERQRALNGLARSD